MKDLARGYDLFEDHAETGYLPGGLQFTSASFRASAGIGTPQTTAKVAGVGTTVAVHTGGITFNLLFDAASSASTTAAANFRAGIIQAASILSSALSDAITVNININYSGTGGGASAGPNYQISRAYSDVASLLKSHATPGDTTFNALPTSIAGTTPVDVFLPEAKALGLFAANDTTYVDGVANFATDISGNALVGVALHEITHAMGRIPDGAVDIFDLFRYTAVNKVLVSSASPSAAAYFSLNNGATALANYGISSDPSDFLNSGVQGGTDPFDEYYSPGVTSQSLSKVDLQQMVALGFHLLPTATPTVTTVAGYVALANANQLTAPVAISDSGANIGKNLDLLNTAVGAGKIVAIAISDAAALTVNAAQAVTDTTALALIGGAYGLAVTDTAANIGARIDALQATGSHLKSLALTDPANAVAITAAQSVNDHAALAMIPAGDKLAITGTAAADTLMDTVGAKAALFGGAGADTFSVQGTATIADLGNGADIVKIAAGANVSATLAGAWTATSATVDLGSATLSTAGYAVNLSAAAPGNGFTVINTSSNGATLIGSNAGDTLVGGSGADILSDGNGNDLLTTGAGADQIIFNTKPNASTNLDTITDFTHGQDILEFSKAIFAGVAESPLSGTGRALASTGELLISSTMTTGQTAAQHFIYNTASGILYYDETGTGASVAVALLGTSTHPTLTYTDIHIIG